jgi:hypothetical protein
MCPAWGIPPVYRAVREMERDVVVRQALTSEGAAVGVVSDAGLASASRQQLAHRIEKASDEVAGLADGSRGGVEDAHVHGLE